MWAGIGAVSRERIQVSRPGAGATVAFRPGFQGMLISEEDCIYISYDDWVGIV